MDSNDLEKERGITILAKATSVEWKGVSHQHRRHPRHADFGGEVERILSMVDGAIVLVDAFRRPDCRRPSSCVGKALKVGLKPIVAINKIDRPDGRHEEVINEVFDLFANLDATDEQLSDFPIMYVRPRWLDERQSGRALRMKVWPAARSRSEARSEAERRHEETARFRMIGTILEANPFLGRIITGRIHSGSIKPNQAVKVLGQTAC